MANGEVRINNRLTWKANWPGMIAGGSSSYPLVIRTYANVPIKIYTTSASTDTGNSVQTVLLDHTMTGAGGVGGRVRINLNVNVVLGGWANALKCSVDCKTNGRATGLLSVLSMQR